MVCSCYRKYRNRGTNKRKSRPTLQPNALLHCGFNFTVIWRDNKWQLKNNVGNRHHCNHYKLSSGDVLRGTRTIPKEEIDFLKSISNTNASSGTIASFLLQRTGQSVTKSALDHLLSTFKDKQTQINSKVGKSQNSAALELITFLKSQSNVTFVAF